MDQLDKQESRDQQVFVPTVQDTINFHEKPLVVVRLPNDNYGVVLRWICENLHLDVKGQIQRIKRTEVIADDLIYVRIQTDGGPQVMPTLVLRAVPYWLATIDTRRMDKDDERRTEILEYQRNAVDALYAWAQSIKAVPDPTDIVASEEIIKPDSPAEGASLEEWRDYHRQMVTWIDWQHDVQRWRGSVNTRLENLESVTSRILEQIGPPTLTPEHQNMVKYYVSQLSRATGGTYAAIYGSLYAAFRVPRYQELPESEWEKVVQWFKRQMPGQELPLTQEKLFE